MKKKWTAQSLLDKNAKEMMGMHMIGNITCKNTGHVRYELGMIFRYDWHNFCSTAFVSRISTLNHFVMPEVQILNHFLKFLKLLLPTLKHNCLSTYKIIKMCYQNIFRKIIRF